jgi:choline dehydrogenase-like flavoprotein
MPAASHFDVIIIGTGAGGGTLAHKLAPTGKRILLVERGPWLKREKENWDPAAVFIQARYKSHETWHDKKGKPFSPGIQYNVGGQTKVYGAALLRFREKDFGELRHAGGVSPAWPISYRDLAPYYLEAERLYQVHGERGGDPTEPECAEPYPFAAVSHEPRIQELHDDLAALGLRPFHLPIGVQLNEASPRKSKCIRCATCDGFPCLVDAKSDSQVCCVEPALERPNVSILTEAMVERLETDASGRQVRKVIVKRRGEREEYSGDIVVVSCGAINSAALLLRSASDKHANGLANRSGVVGRHYMCHNNSALLAISRKPNPTVFQKTIAVNDFYFGDPQNGFDYPMGHISMIGKSDAVMLSEGAPPLTPRAVLDQMAKHSLDFWMTSEDLPDPENRVTLDADGGIVLSHTPNNEEAHDRLIARLKGLLRQIGCEENRLLPNAIYLGKKIPLAGVAHQCGTVRFGTDPASSALDVNCKAHDVDNLYVVDASFFVSSTAVNPALTIMANALRVGEHLAQRLN